MPHGPRLAGILSHLNLMVDANSKIDALVRARVQQRICDGAEWFYELDEFDRATLWDRFADNAEWKIFPQDELQQVILREMVSPLELYAELALRDPRHRTFRQYILLSDFDALESGESAAIHCSILVSPEVDTEDASVLSPPRTAEAKRVPACQ